MPRWTIMINYHIAFVDNLQPIIDEMMYTKNRTVLITYNSNSACSSVRLFHRRCFLLYLKRFSLVPTYICEMCKSPTICIKRIELHHMFNYFLESFFYNMFYQSIIKCIQWKCRIYFSALLTCVSWLLWKFFCDIRFTVYWWLDG